MMDKLTAEPGDIEVQQAVSAICPECEQKMRYKEKRGRPVHTEIGEVRQLVWLADSK